MPAILRLEGKDRVDFLHRLTTNDLVGTPPGQGRYTVLLNTRGRVVDLALALLLEEEILLIPSSGNAGKIGTFLDGYLFREEVTLRSDATLACGLLYGAEARAAFGRAAQTPWEDGALGDHRPCRIDGIEGRITRVLPMRGDTFRLIFPQGDRARVEKALLQAGAFPGGEAALEMYRVEAMVPELGRELSEEFNPWEVSLDRAIHLQKGCYLGQEVVARLHTYRKVQRRLAGFEITGPVPELPAPLLSGSETAGTLTSAAPSPSGDRLLGLGVLRAALCRPGQELRAGAPESPILCRVREDAPPLSESLGGPS